MRPKIFVIGFNRCGTYSLHLFFEWNDIASLHFRPDDGETTPILPHVMSINHSLGRPLFQGLEHFDVFSDMGVIGRNFIFEGIRYFREIDVQYPGSYFILNTRPVDHWIASRLMHRRGRDADFTMKTLGIERKSLVYLWEQQFADHVGNVREYFSNRPKQLLEFDIESGDPAAIADFLASDYDIDPGHWGQYNASEERPETPENWIAQHTNVAAMG